MELMWFFLEGGTSAHVVFSGVFLEKGHRLRPQRAPGLIEHEGVGAPGPLPPRKAVAARGLRTKHRRNTFAFLICVLRTFFGSVLGIASS